MLESTVRSIRTLLTPRSKLQRETHKVAETTPETISSPAVQEEESSTVTTTANPANNINKGTLSVPELYQLIDSEVRVNLGASVKCGICLETMKSPTRTLCGHGFCKTCIHTWLQYSSSSCPECHQTGVTKRSLQPHVHLQGLAKQFKQALTEFALVPSQYTSSFTTLTQKPMGESDSSDEEEDDDDDVEEGENETTNRRAQKHLDRLHVAMVWRDQAIPKLSLSETQKEENRQIVEANREACEQAGLLLSEMSATTTTGGGASRAGGGVPTTQEVQEEAREHQAADADLPESPTSVLMDCTNHTTPRINGSNTGSPSLKERGGPSSQDPPVNLPQSLSPIAFQLSQASQPAVVSKAKDTDGTMTRRSRRNKSSSQETTTGPSASSDPPSSNISPARQPNPSIANITGLQEDSFGALHWTSKSLTLSSREDTLSPPLLDDHDDDDYMQQQQQQQQQDDETMVEEQPQAPVTGKPDETNEDDDSEVTIPYAMAPVNNKHPTNDSVTPIQKGAGGASRKRRPVSAPPAIISTPSKSPPKSPTAATTFALNDIVRVASRTWSGINKPGGVARIRKINPDGSYNVAYILGGRESNVDPAFVSSTENPGKRRRLETFEAAFPTSLLQELVQQGFDPTVSLEQAHAAAVKREAEPTPVSTNVTTKTATAPKPPSSLRKATSLGSANVNTSTTTTANSKPKKPRTKKSVRIMDSQDYSSTSDACPLADARYKQMKQASSGKKMILHVVASNLSDQDMAKLLTICEQDFNKVSLKLEETFSKKTSLCVTPMGSSANDGDTNTLSRTVKVMRSALAGIPIVSPDWLSACMVKNDLVDIIPYVARSMPSKSTPITNAGESHFGVAKLAANMHKQAPAPLQKTSVFFCGSFPAAQRRDLQVLAREAGAKVLSSHSAVLASLGKQRVVLVCHDSSGVLVPAAIAQTVKKILESDASAVLVVNPQWIFESITCAKALPSTHFPPSNRTALDLFRIGQPSQSKKK